MGNDQFWPKSVVVIVIIVHTIARSQDLGIMMVINAIKMSEMVKESDFSVPLDVNIGQGTQTLH